MWLDCENRGSEKIGWREREWEEVERGGGQTSVPAVIEPVVRFHERILGLWRYRNAR